MSWRPSVILSSWILASPVWGQTPALPQGAETAAEQIAASLLSGHVRFLSHDLLEGRGASSRGDELARAYIASTFEGLGLRPGGPDGSWQQSFDIVGVTTTLPKSWSFTAGGTSLALTYYEDYIGTIGNQQEMARLDGAELVFVGYGMQAPEYGWDDFKGMDLRGKILVVLNNDPDWDDTLFAGKTRLYYGRWDYKYESAARQGAAGALIVHTTPSAGYPFQVVQTSWSGEQFELPATGEPRVQFQGWVTEDAAKRLVALGGKDLAKLVESAKKKSFKPVPLGVTTSLELQANLSRTRTANVLGLLPGRDPVLAKEVVVYTAHHDHLGVGEPNEKGDTIYNGALDNASGVAQVLAIARAFKALPEPPKRSILFLAVGVEESGLLGSEHYAAHPTFAPGRIAANVNIDGGNIWGRTKDLAMVGLGKSSMDEVAVAIAAKQGRIVKPDQFPDRGFFYRSDQFNFAKIGVPALYCDSGVDFVGRPEGWGKEQIEAWEATHYHQPSDELTPAWNFDGLIQDAQFAFWCGLAVAEAPALPAWKPGDEFEAARKQALAALDHP